MANILIWKEYNPGNHVDIYRRLDYNTLSKEIIEFCGGGSTNTGNKVWMQGLISEISTEDNNIYYRNNNESWDYINSFYDMIIFSTANLICTQHKSYIEQLAKDFCNSRIPVYVLSIGAQTSNYDRKKELCESIGAEVKEFIRAIYNSGGEFGLRGWFTKEVFDSICPNTAVVTGCPSLFQNGRKLEIRKKKSKDFKLVLNGELKDLENYLLHYDGIFIDQDYWYKECYDIDYWKGRSKREIIKDMIARHGITETRLFFEDKIKQFYDIPEWRRYLIEGDFTFSIGSRIHGSIMSILSGIPALLVVIDSRTREMAEYYGIPCIFSLNKNESLEELYAEMNYEEFNKGYEEKYMRFREFLIKHRIVKEINEYNSFWEKELPIYNNVIETKKRQCCGYIERHRFLMNIYEIGIRCEKELKYRMVRNA